MAVSFDFVVVDTADSLRPIGIFYLQGGTLQRQVVQNAHSAISSLVVQCCANHALIWFQ